MSYMYLKSSLQDGNNITLFYQVLDISDFYHSRVFGHNHPSYLSQKINIIFIALIGVTHVTPLVYGVVWFLLDNPDDRRHLKKKIIYIRGNHNIVLI